MTGTRLAWTLNQKDGECFLYQIQVSLMKTVITLPITEAIAELRNNGLFHLNGFLAIIERQPSDKTKLSSKTILVIIKVFEKEIELLHDACQFCFTGTDQTGRMQEMRESIVLLHRIIDHLRNLPEYSNT